MRSGYPIDKIYALARLLASYRDELMSDELRPLDADAAARHDQAAEKILGALEVVLEDFVARIK